MRSLSGFLRPSDQSHPLLKLLTLEPSVWEHVDITKKGRREGNTEDKQEGRSRRDNAATRNKDRHRKDKQEGKEEAEERRETFQDTQRRYVSRAG